MKTVQNRIEDLRTELEIASSLRQLREKANVSRSLIARKLGVTEHTVKRIETTGVVKVTTLDKFLASLGCHIEIKAITKTEQITLWKR